MPLFRLDKARESAPVILSLVKDSGWCYSLGIVSLITVIPVLTFQVYEIWKCRKEGYHKILQNVMATMALSANVSWMLADLYFGERFRHYAKWLFAVGLAFLLVYGILLLLGRKSTVVVQATSTRVMAVSRSTKGLVFVHSRRSPHMTAHSGHLMVRRRQNRSVAQ